MMIFFDLHLWDVSWKYANSTKQEETLRTLLAGCSAVLTPFPRTYYDLPKVVSECPNSIFLTCSPTMRVQVETDESYSIDLCKRFNILSSDKLILYPAQLQLHKNHLVLFKALKKINRKDVKLICTGSEFKATYTATLRSAIDELGLSDSITIAGYVENVDLETLYKRADLIVSASLAEGGAYLAQEAIVQHKNVIVSSIRSARMHLNLMKADIPLFNPLSITDCYIAIRTGLEIKQDHSVALKIINSWTWGKLADEYDQIIRWVSGGCLRGEMPIMASEHISLGLSSDNF